jgi:hypothetical protein
MSNFFPLSQGSDRYEFKYKGLYDREIIFWLFVVLCTVSVLWIRNKNFQKVLLPVLYIKNMLILKTKFSKRTSFKLNLLFTYNQCFGSAFI